MTLILKQAVGKPCLNWLLDHWRGKMQTSKHSWVGMQTWTQEERIKPDDANFADQQQDE
jgi:hypothetical protein